MRKIVSILLLITVAFAHTACSFRQEHTTDIQDYREIPGVTGEEINAIEELKAQGASFVYGMQYSSESFQREDGTYGGFSALFCEHLTNLFGIPFELGLYELDDLISKLESGQIHFTTELSPSAERIAKYEMSDSISHRVVKLVRLRDAPSPEEITKTREPRYVILRSSSTYSFVLESGASGFSILFSDTYAGALELMRRGEADGLLADNVAEASFLEALDVEFKDFYPLVYKPKPLVTADSRLAPILSVVDKYLQSNHVEDMLHLYDEGYRDYQRYAFQQMLTEDEAAYLEERKQSGGIRVLYEYDKYPVSFYNEKESEFQGIAVDVLNEFSELSGVPLSIKGGNGLLSFVEEQLDLGEVDIVSELMHSEGRADRYIWPESVNMVDKYVLVSRADSDLTTIGSVMSSRVALVDSSPTLDIFRSWFPGHEHIVVYMSSEEAYDALEAGEVDLVMSTQKMLSSYTNYKERPVFQASILFEDTYESKFGFSRENEILANIIDKAHRLIDTDSIADSWNFKVFDYQAEMYRMQIPYFVTCLLLLLSVLILVVVFLVRKRHENQRLELTVRERTSDLEIQKRELVGKTEELEEKTRELQVQTQAAQVASEAKGEFLARMSHEIRTPLNAIVGMTDIGKSAETMEKKQFCFEQIEGASNQLLGIINDILDMSKIEANKLEIVNQDMDLEQMLMNVSNVINFRVEEKKQTFFVDIDKAIPMKIIGDELRLTQVTTNLLSNAVKFTPEGGLVRLNVTAEAKHDNRYKLRFEICDNGIGISKKDQAKLFQSFEQADGGIARRFGGTGLGLSISKRLVELMGGDIWVESEPGKGSKFIFTIECERSRISPQPSLHPEIDREQLRVLVADDSKEIRSYIANLMEAFGIPCDSAADGFEALELFADAVHDRPYNIILADWQMPKMDGIELSKRIKSISEDNVVILISIANQEDVEERAQGAGINKVLPKPIFPSMLINAVNESLGLATVTKSPEKKEKSFDFHGKTALLAEDIPINREIVKTYLEDTGLEIDEAESGVVAFHKFSRNPDKYDVVLMDIHMPDMDGYEATSKIRQLEFPKAKSIPIIAMTANVFQEDIDKCLSIGMNNHIGKPVKMNDLREKLTIYLSETADAAPAPPAPEQAEPVAEQQEEPYIDWHEAMEMVGGNEQIYLKLLKDFQGQQLYRDLLDDIAQGDSQRVKLSAHALKGVAASLSLKRLYKVVVEIEQLSKEEKSTTHLRQTLESVFQCTLLAREDLLANKQR